MKLKVHLDYGVNKKPESFCENPKAKLFTDIFTEVTCCDCLRWMEIEGLNE